MIPNIDLKRILGPSEVVHDAFSVLEKYPEEVFDVTYYENGSYMRKQMKGKDLLKDRKINIHHLFMISQRKHFFIDLEIRCIR